LLTSDTLTLENVPHLADVEQLLRILGNHGVDVSVNGRRERQEDSYSRTIHFTCRTIVDTTAPYELVSKMRASFWVIGPLLAREGQCRVSLPGGCAIGTRPVDLFLEGLTALGANLEIDAAISTPRRPKGGLIGAKYTFPKVSVGATHVMMMAATLARGTTVIGNAAREPEVVDLANCLIAMGAKITGAGTATITIEGVTTLSGARHRVLPDRIETGTYAMAVAMAGGDVVLENTDVALLDTALETLRRAGAEISPTNNGMRVVAMAPASAGRYRHRSLPGLPDRPAGAVHGADDPLDRRLARHRDHLRKPLHARAGTGPPRRQDLALGPDGEDRRRAAPQGCACHGDRSARLRVARHRRPCRRRRDHGVARLSPRSRLRAPRRKAHPLRRHRRTRQRISLSRTVN
jgi:UDP-N-acetylglucosamine enolpyruvyl transferase